MSQERQLPLHSEMQSDREESEPSSVASDPLREDELEYGLTDRERRAQKKRDREELEQTKRRLHERFGIEKKGQSDLPGMNEKEL